MTAAEPRWPLYAGSYHPRVVAGRRVRLPYCGCGCGKPAIWVGKGSRYANLFRVHRRIELHANQGLTSTSLSLKPKDRLAAVDLFADFVTDGITDPILGFTLHHSYLDPDVIRAELAGHDLACDCLTSVPCHAEVLLQIANRAIYDDLYAGPHHG